MNERSSVSHGSFYPPAAHPGAQEVRTPHDLSLRNMPPPILPPASSGPEPPAQCPTLSPWKPHFSKTEENAPLPGLPLLVFCACGIQPRTKVDSRLRVLNLGAPNAERWLWVLGFQWRQPQMFPIPLRSTLSKTNTCFSQSDTATALYEGMRRPVSMASPEDDGPC